jgi:O-antigen ligase
MKLDKFQQFFTWGVLAVFMTPLFVFPWVQFPFQTAKVLGFEVLVLLLLPLFVYLGFRDGFVSDKKYKLLLFFLGLILVMLMASLFGLDPWNSFWGNAQRPGGGFLMAHVFLFLLYLLHTVAWFGLTFIRMVTRVLVGGAVITSVYAVCEILGILPSMAEPFLPRTSSVFGNPAFFGTYLVVPFWIALYGAKIERAYKKYYVAVSGIILLAVLLSATRAALLAIGIGGVCWFLLSLLQKRKVDTKKILKMGGGFVAVALVLFAIASFVLPDYSFFRISETDSQRLNYWSMAVQGWVDAPLLGVGLENFSYVADRYFDPEFYSIADSWPDKPHNAFLEILVTTGALGVFVYMAFLAQLVRGLWKHDERLLLFSALLSYLVVHAFLFETVVSYVMLSLFVVFAFVASAPTKVRISMKLNIPFTVAALTVFVLVAAFIYVPYHSQAKMVQAAYSNGSVNLALELSAYRYPFNLPLLARIQGDVLGAGFRNGEAEITKLGDHVTDMYVRALERHPADASLTLAFAAHYVHLVEYGLAETVDPYVFELLDKARELAPGRLEPDVTESRILQLSGELQAAIELTESLLEVAPNDAQILGLMGEQYMEAGRVDEAVNSIYKALDLGFSDPGHQVLLWLIGQLSEQGDTERMIYILERAIIWDPNAYLAYELLMGVHDSLGDVKAARAVGEALLRVYPESHSVVEAYLEQTQ